MFLIRLLDLEGERERERERNWHIRGGRWRMSRFRKMAQEVEKMV